MNCDRELRVETEKGDAVGARAGVLGDGHDDGDVEDYWRNEIMTREEMPFHAAANIFPLDDENIGSLADDIRTNGQQVPIELLDGAVIDGRRRWLACSIAQVEPITRDVSPSDPIAYVLSLNLHRRHLSTSQLAMVGARARELYDEQAKERQRVRKGHQAGSTVENLPQLDKARDAAGKAVGVSGKSIDYARRVLNGEPELIAAVDDDKISVSTAARVSSRPREEQVAMQGRLS